MSKHNILDGRDLLMRTAAKKINRPASLTEIFSTLTKSLAFQVQMIMWEDRKSGSAGARGLAAGTGAGLKNHGSLI